ncbi:30S ribosomal protein S2 [Candidatus Riesia pediculicola]|uniref:Small ribosomal subunit protein uS2 n=1 Tax=Riesia pediculicola (strain USDA) TaxID=515618 RepID=D4G8E9_RIEPU|nr:30S ribosomal protein S2 [Candidatus Riesia pediculicola]ADD79851.1 ribosomal protein S2 [Candidatus Riesia pediculicola USDA]ARC53836.1 30S ribosomal protein S2 [Candidatus Riesia pediculicola]QOJ86468.1 30S ribosomal protein S2 [Candidatus Riesia pediculicola]
MHFSISEMIECGVHFGHQRRYWNPKMKDYIFGVQNNIHIIDLEKTSLLLRSASEKINKIVERRGKILFVGTKRSASSLIKESAIYCEQYFVNKRWLGGTLTNWKTVRQSIKKLNELESQIRDGIFKKLTKKEALIRTRKFQKLENSLGGIKKMSMLPDAMFIIDVEHEKIAVKEANILNIQTFAIVDTNSNPDGIDHVIPGNDDSIKSIKFYLEYISHSIRMTQEKSKNNIDKKYVNDVFIHS